MTPKTLEEKIDQLIDSNARLEYILIGDEKSCVPGLCGRVKRLEEGVFKVAAIASAISAPIGFFIGLVVKIV